MLLVLLDVMEGGFGNGFLGFVFLGSGSFVGGFGRVFGLFSKVEFGGREEVAE